MVARSRRAVRLGVVLLLLVAALTTPAIAHEGHAGHDSGSDDERTIWPFLVVVGTLSAGGSLLASRTLDVPGEFAIGLAAGGIAIAVGAGVVWLL